MFKILVYTVQKTQEVDKNRFPNTKLNLMQQVDYEAVEDVETK
jgi:hypothetical protein